MTQNAPAVLPSPEDLYERHFSQVFTLAFRLTGNRSDAEDLTHDVFLRLFASAASYEPGNLAGWIHRVTTNLFLDGVRRRKRRPESPLGDHQDLVPATSALPEKVLHDSGFDPDVETALAALPVNFRVAVLLSDVEQLSAEEISEVLGVKVATVRTRIHRGRIQLRRELAHRAPGPGRTRVLGPVGV